MEKKQDQFEARQNSSVNPILFSGFFNLLWGSRDASVQYYVFFLLFTRLTCTKKSPDNSEIAYADSFNSTTLWGAVTLAMLL